MEVVKVSHRILSTMNVGVARLSLFEFDKRRVYRNKNGEVNSEVPFKQLSYALNVGKKVMWLSAHEWSCLRDLVLKAGERLDGADSPAD